MKPSDNEKSRDDFFAVFFSISDFNKRKIKKSLMSALLVENASRW
jgi:hypothetical protein